MNVVRAAASFLWNERVVFVVFSVAAIVGSLMLVQAASGLHAVLSNWPGAGAAGWGVALGLFLVIVAGPIGWLFVFVAARLIDRSVWLVPVAALTLVAAWLGWQLVSGVAYGGPGRLLQLWAFVVPSALFARAALPGVGGSWWPVVLRGGAVAAVGTMALVPPIYAAAVMGGQPPDGTVLLETRVGETEVRAVAGSEVCVWTGTPTSIPGVVAGERECDEFVPNRAFTIQQTAPDRWVVVVASLDGELRRVRAVTDAGEWESRGPSGIVLFLEAPGDLRAVQVWIDDSDTPWLDLWAPF